MNIVFNAKYDKILSLGSKCCVKFFIEKILKPPYGNTELFDYIGTSMGQINELIVNDFEDLTTDTYFELLNIIYGEDPIVTNTKYYMRFKHDLRKPEDACGLEFKNKMKRRILRFKQNIEKSKNILFIRQEESNFLRVPYKLQKKSELEELREFIDILHGKYKCGKITVIYINANTDGWNEQHDIFSVKIPSLDYDWKKAHTHLESLFNEKEVMKFI